MLTNCYIISDLHLSTHNPHIAKLFSHFLKEITTPGNKLYILGDFFDYWIGDDDLSSFNLSITSILNHAVENGLKVYLMHGNRDFLISQKFAKRSGVILIPEPLTLYNKQQAILLMHGDLMCTDDKNYQLFRKIVRNPTIKSLYLLLPLLLRKKIAKIIRQKSHKKYTKYKAIDITINGINRYINNHEILIHGHTHSFNYHHSTNYIRYVLGNWHNTVGNFIKIHDNKISLNRYYYTE